MNNDIKYVMKMSDYNTQVYKNGLDHTVFQIQNPPLTLQNELKSAFSRKNQVLRVLDNNGYGSTDYFIQNMKLVYNLISNSIWLEIIVSEEEVVENKPDFDINEPLGGNKKLYRNIRDKI